MDTQFEDDFIKAVWAPWTDPDSKKTGFILYPTEELWNLIQNKEFIVDDVMGLAPDNNTYSHFERLVYLLSGLLYRAKEEFEISNPAKYVETLVEIRDEYAQYLEDTQARDDTYRDYNKMVLESTIEDINCFCV